MLNTKLWEKQREEQKKENSERKINKLGEEERFKRRKQLFKINNITRM